MTIARETLERVRERVAGVQVSAPLGRVDLALQVFEGLGREARDARRVDMRFDVVIVGAGIGGAVLALDLGRRGWRIALVERESAPPKIARPEILWSPTTNALERYGVADAIRERASVKLEAIEIGGEKPWLRITREDFDAAGVDAFSTNPSMTRAIIADAAVATGNVEIHRGVAVEELLRENGRVAGIRSKQLVIEARLVVGDDGGNSIVRAQLGIPITLTPFPIEFVTAMIPQWTLPPSRARVWIDGERLRRPASRGPAAKAFFSFRFRRIAPRRRVRTTNASRGHSVTRFRTSPMAQRSSETRFIR